jgi:Protein of unknown function (DUF1236)
MKNRRAVAIAFGMLVLGCASVSAQQIQTLNPGGDAGVSGAIEQKLLLTSAQRLAIYQEVSKDSGKTAAKEFSPVIGADVPPMIELYALPDDTLAEVPAAKLYKYTMVQNKVVVVDPTRMRVIDVIEPAPKQ